MVERIHGGNLDEVARRYGLDAQKILDFSSNINPHGPPKVVVDYLSRVSVKDVANYPDMNCVTLRSVLAKNLDLNERNLLITNGSSEAIFLLVNYLRPPKALIVSPTFCEYEIAIISTGGERKNLNLQKDKNFAFPLDLTISELNDVDMLFLCNPNNPTGNLCSRDNLVELLGEARKKDVFVVVDEAFMDFVLKKEDYTLKLLVNEYSNLAVLGSLTKFYSLAGLRVGYIVSNESLIFKLKNKTPAWNVNALAQKTAAIALKDKDFKMATLGKNMKARDKLLSIFSNISDLKVYPSQTNFLLAEVVTDKFNSKTFYTELLRRGFYVRNCVSFSGLSERFFRMAIRSEEENRILVEAIGEILI